MKTQIDKIEYSNVQKISRYGGFDIQYTYEVFTTCEMDKNHYEVTCKVIGVATGEIELEVIEVLTYKNNQNTLTAESLCEVLDWHYLEPTFKYSSELESQF